MRRTSPLPHTLMAAIGVTCLITAGQPAVAQVPAWGWGMFGNPTTRWSPEAVSDYLLTGHTPRPAVARIVAPEHGGTSLGSGVLVDVNRSQGLVLTNYHVIRDSRSAVLVQFPDGFQSAGTVIRWDEAWDLAAIVIWRPAATPVAIAAAPPVPGERLTIAGYGRGTYREESGPCTEYLSPGAGYPKEFVELRATARQGDSGGPIFNAEGNLAGVLFGQNDGRTLGSCSTRVRAFLATAGSGGFTPTPMGEFSNARVAETGPPAAVTAGLPPAAGGGPSQPVAARLQAGPAAPTGGPPSMPATDQGVAPGIVPGVHAGDPGGSLPGAGAIWPQSFGPPPAAGGRDIWEMLDARRNGPALLSSAGGLALVVLGLRTVFGGRRRQPKTPAAESW